MSLEGNRKLTRRPRGRERERHCPFLSSSFLFSSTHFLPLPRAPPPPPPPNANLQVHNEAGSKRVVVTKGLPGDRWLRLLTDAGARVEVCTSADTILSVSQIKSLIGDKCDGVIGQLTEVSWKLSFFVGVIRKRGRGVKGKEKEGATFPPLKRKNRKKNYLHRTGATSSSVP